jgi:hypothetical protein
MQRIDVERIVISEGGELFVKRDTRLPWRQIKCCQDDAYCGDWCSCFGNPDPLNVSVYDNRERCLVLCKSYLVARVGYHNLVDLRMSDDNIVGDDGSNALPSPYLLG